MGRRYLLAAGDISSEAVTGDLGRAKELLDGSAPIAATTSSARGNHDRAHDGAPYATCSAGQWQGNDCFRDEFFPGDEPHLLHRDLNGLHIIGLDTYDKPGNGGDAGGLSAEQMAWFQADLQEHKDQPTLVFGHHPLSERLRPVRRSPVARRSTSGRPCDDLRRYAQAPGVFLHHAGHTHRNKRTVRPAAPGT